MENWALARLDRKFCSLYAQTGCPSIPPEQLLRALLLQVLYMVRSERLLMEQLEYSLLFRWFVNWGSRCMCRRATKIDVAQSTIGRRGLCPDFADTSRKADTGPGGVSWRAEGSFQTSLNSLGR